MNMLPPHSRRSTALLALAAAAGYFAVAQIGLAFRTDPERLAIFWPPNGLLLGLLLVCRPGARVPVVVASAVACFGANLAGGNSAAVSLGFTAVNVAEPGLAAWALLRLCGGSFGLSNTRQVFYLFAVALAVPLASAGPGAAVVVFGLGAPNYWGVFMSFWLADAMGLLLVVPAVVAWSGRCRVCPGSVARALEAAALFGGVGAVAGLIFAEDSRTAHYLLSYPFPLFPFFVWAGLRFGLRGGTTVLLVVSLVTVWNTGRGTGPFVEPGVPRAQHLLMVQFFLSAMALTTLTLGATLAEREAARRALAESEERYRQVTETSAEVFWIVAADLSRVIYISPAYEAVWGRTTASLYADPASYLAGVHPDDRDRIMAAHARIAAGPVEVAHRVVRPDGTERIVRARAFAVTDPDGRVVRVVGVARDETEREEAERARTALIEQLQTALAEIKTLRGLIPVCAWCRKVRDDDGFWGTVESYICKHTEASVSHGMCPDCYDRVAAAYPGAGA